jgi:hypothetical protein
MYIIYYVELPFFEKHKINNAPWPWKENKEEWVKKLKKSLMI